MPVTIDKQDADVWLPEQLADREPGTAMVVMHSVMWQYMTEDDRAACKKAIEDAGAAATTDTPVAWLRLEPHPETFFPGELRVRTWDGRSDERKARGQQRLPRRTTDLARSGCTPTTLIDDRAFTRPQCSLGTRFHATTPTSAPT